MNLTLLAVLRRYMRPYRRLVAAGVVFQLASTVASLYLPSVAAAIIDRGVIRGDTDTIVRLGAVMLSVSGLQVFFALGAVYFGARTAIGLGRDLREAVFDQVLSFSAREAERFGTPSLFTRTTNDVPHVEVLVAMTLTVLVAAPITGVVGVLMAVRQDAGLSWLLFLGVPVLGLANYWIVSHMVPIFWRMQDIVDIINHVLREQLSGVKVVRAFGREPTERARFGEVNRRLSDTFLAVGRWQALLLPVSTLAINVSGVAVIWFGGLRVDAGHMQFGSLIAFLSYFMQILIAVGMATTFVAMLPRATVCAGRISEVLATSSAVAKPVHPLAPAAEGIVTLDRATFSYPGADQPVVNGVTLTAVPGSTTGIVGSTGSGKTTLISLICRLYDVTSGSVSVDGVDVREYDPEVLWARIGLVPQRGYLFTGTIADNLRYGSPNAADDDMWRALRIAAADEFVDRLDMPVAQGGVNLSGGQRQRLAIARAVLRNPPVYVLDDALSALDVHTDAKVRSRLREATGRSTVIIVSQRISSIADADRIVVLDAGRVVNEGTHHSLLRSCTVYAELAASQLTPR